MGAVNFFATDTRNSKTPASIDSYSYICSTGMPSPNLEIKIRSSNRTKLFFYQYAGHSARPRFGANRKSLVGRHLVCVDSQLAPIKGEIPIFSPSFEPVQFRESGIIKGLIGQSLKLVPYFQMKIRKELSPDCSNHLLLGIHTHE